MLIFDPNNNTLIKRFSFIDSLSHYHTSILILVGQIQFDNFMTMNQVQTILKLNNISKGLKIDIRQVIEYRYWLQFITIQCQSSLISIFI